MLSTFAESARSIEIRSTRSLDEKVSFLKVSRILAATAGSVGNFAVISRCALTLFTVGILLFIKNNLQPFSGSCDSKVAISLSEALSYSATIHVCHISLIRFRSRIG